MSKSTTTTPRITKQLTLEQVATLSGDPSKGVSLCIPRVFANISWFRIKEVFIALNWGYVDRVDVIPSGGTKRAFVHLHLADSLLRRCSRHFAVASRSKSSTTNLGFGRSHSVVLRSPSRLQSARSDQRSRLTRLAKRRLRQADASLR